MHTQRNAQTIQSQDYGGKENALQHSRRNHCMSSCINQKSICKKYQQLTIRLENKLSCICVYVGVL